MKALARLVAAAVISMYLLIGSPGSALAECDGPIPDFRVVVRSASRVFVGDITAVDNPGTDGFGSRFTTLVRYVLRGRVHQWPMNIRDLRGSPCSPAIQATKGQRIALALGGTDNLLGRSVTVNSVAYITGDAPSSWAGSDPHLRFDVIYRLAGVPLATNDAILPSSSTTDAVGSQGISKGSGLLLSALGFAVALGLLRWPHGHRYRLSSSPNEEEGH